MFSQTEVATYFRLAKTPRGPTLTFKVKGYSLMKDIRKTQKSPKSLGMEFTRPPLLVMNNFTHEDLPQGKLVTTMFQHMLPPINIQKMRLGDAKRILLLNYNADTNTIDFRHYRIEVKESGVSRGVRKLFNGSISDLSKFNDISDFVKREDLGAESDVEDGPDNQVTLDSSMSNRSGANQTRSVKLYEIGPRMDLELIKIEAGLNAGETLYHRNIKRSNAEQKKLDKERNIKNQEKALRRQEQEKNVQRKKEEKEKHKAATSAIVKDEDEDAELSEDEDEDDDEEAPNAEEFEDDDEDLFDEDEEVDQDEIDDDDDEDDFDEEATAEEVQEEESESEDESIPPPTKSKKLRK
jgi:ribosome biogenesis protein SSF1/2